MAPPLARRRPSARVSWLWILGLVLIAGATLQPLQCLMVGRRALQATVCSLGAVVLELFVRLDWRGTHKTKCGRAAGRDVRPLGVADAEPCSDVTFRVVKGMGSRGYDAVRVTAIYDAPIAGEVDEDLLQQCPPAGHTHLGAAMAFDRCNRFQQRWTDFHSSTAVVRVKPGENSLRFNHTTGPLHLQVSLPPRGAGVHGLIIGDPCISSRYMPGLCNMQFDVINRLPRLLNMLNSVDRLDFVILLGDAFYDVHGGLTAEFWRRLSKKTQQTFLLSVPGNHDFWMFAPQAPLPQDQLGIGFAQWYAQDTATSQHQNLTQTSSTPTLPEAEEFFFYHMIGDIGFLGFSNAHTWEAQEHLFREACDYFEDELPNQVYLLSHWSKEDLGCQPGMDMPSIFGYLREGHCRAVAPRMRYLMGHDHCNQATADGLGFLIGGGGAAHGGCNEWGVGYLDTRPAAVVPGKGSARWGAFGQGAAAAASHVMAKLTLATDTVDHFPALEYCLSVRRSLRDCLPEHAAEVWLNSTVSMA